MDDLPPPLLIEILSRLPAADLARCRTVSKSLSSLSAEVRSIKLHCSADLYARSRGPIYPIPPFKSIFTSLLFNLLHVDSISISVFKPRSDCIWCNDMEDDEDDLYLTDERWVEQWLGRVGGGLTSVSISDFWMQSCWRRSGVLALISSICHNLVQLELKNAWLSMDRLKQMPSLTSLTLEFIRLDDDNLTMVNKSFPSLQVLKLVGVGGLTDPKIQLSHLITCEWSVSNAIISLSILAPSLVSLKLKCVKLKSISIHAPMLSDFLFSLEGTDFLEIKDTLNLKTIQLAIRDSRTLLSKFPVCEIVENLRLDTPLDLERLFEIFPNRKSLVLGPGAWWEYTRRGLNLTNGAKSLREITAYIPFDTYVEISTFICHILNTCSDLTNVSLLIHSEVGPSVRRDFIKRCLDSCSCAKVTWRWGF